MFGGLLSTTNYSNCRYEDFFYLSTRESFCNNLNRTTYASDRGSIALSTKTNGIPNPEDKPTGNIEDTPINNHNMPGRIDMRDDEGVLNNTAGSITNTT
eukprot:scaffold21989_cov78-Skeletonema_dohrnii-CCMP3373.AAC.1